MDRSIGTSVVVVGAGPVGLTLALDLASRNVNVTVLETRKAGEPPNVKCNQVSARSMETFRRLGIADKIRNTGLPAEYRNDVVCCVSATGTELARIKLPSRLGRMRGEKGDDSWWPTAEFPHRINQLFLEPLLFSQAVAEPRTAFSTAHNLRNFRRMTPESTPLPANSTTVNASPSEVGISWAVTVAARSCAMESALSLRACLKYSACSRHTSARLLSLAGCRPTLPGCILHSIRAVAAR